MPSVSIDSSICAGHGRCYVALPGIFESDNDGFGQVRAESAGQVSEAEAEQAVDTCPEHAVQRTAGASS